MSDTLKILIPVIGLILFVISFYRSKKIINPLGLIIFIWIFFLWLSNFSLTGYFPPSFYTQALVILMLISCSIGGLLGNSKKIRNAIDYDRKYNFLLKIVYLLVIPFFVYLLFVSSKLILNYGFWGYMYITRFQIGVEGMGRDAIFGAGYLRIIFNTFIYPILTAAFYIGTAFIFLKKRNHLFIVASILLIIHGIVLTAMSDFFTISVVVSLVLIIVLTNKSKFDASNYKKIKKLSFRIIIIGFTLILLLATQRGRNLNLNQIILRYGVGYHTLGFTMFDKELLNEKSYLNENLTYGRAVFGLPDQLLEVLSRRIDKEGIRSISRELIVMQDEKIHVGYYDWGNGTEKIESNAFYTILYYLYLDGRLFGVVIIPIIYSYLLMSFFLRWRRGNDPYSFTMILFLFMVGLDALKMPSVIRPYFWPTIIILWVFGNLKVPIFEKQKI